MPRAKNKNASRSDSVNGDRPTEEEYAQRVELVINMVAKAAKKHEMKAVLNMKYGVSARTAESYIAQAKLEIKERASRHKDELFGESMSFYEMVIRDPGASMSEKMAARAALDSLFGLNAPVAVEHKPVALPPIFIGIINGRQPDNYSELRSLPETVTVPQQSEEV